MRSSAWRKSLSGKAVIRYFLLVVLASVVISGIFYFFWKTNLLKVEQTVHWDLAQDLVRRIELQQGFAEADEQARKQLVLKEFYYLSTVNPRVDPYLVDETGKTIISLFSEYRLKQISLVPVEQFFHQEGFPITPIYGDNPRTDGAKKILFTAAPIKFGDKTAVIYVVTSGKRYWVAFQQFTDLIAIVGTIILFIVVAIVSTGLGNLVFLQLSKSLREIIEVAQCYATGDFSKRIKLASDDELGTVASTMNSMAERISDNMQQLAQADSLRRELISNISHDMRHPVAVMQTALESLLARINSIDAAQQQDALSRALSSCKHLNSQLDELFSLAKLNSTDYQLRYEEFSLTELCEEVAAINRQRAETGGIALEVLYEDLLPNVRADVALIERVLTNLLANAIRHTPEGGTISIRVSSGTDVLVVEIEDTGSGIPEQDLPHIFDRYFTAAREGKSEGSGLGLAIVKRVLELHKSTIKVRSSIGQGTAFQFTVPVIPATR